MKRIIVAGIGTEVGKTVASAILAQQMNADYWKPIQSGESDAKIVEGFLGKERVHPPLYHFETPVSPHYAAEIEGETIDLNMEVPKSNRPLVIETVGGILSPLTNENPAIDLFSRFGGEWVLVSRHYLGSINHTLLTLEAMQSRDLPLKGILFNGDPLPHTEQPILKKARVPILGRIFPEATITKERIEWYAKQWQ